MKTLELDRFADIDSPLSRWDCRWKLAAAALFILAVACLHQLSSSVAAFLIASGAVLLARLPIGAVLGRLRAILLVILIIAVILALSAGGPRVSSLGLEFSSRGLFLGGRLMAKALAIVLALLTATSTSPAQRTLSAMRHLRIPSGLIQVFHLSYRYLFLLQRELQTIRGAMAARRFQLRMNTRALGMIGNVVGMLLIRSIERADRVYLAMQARGFDGNFRPRVPFRTAPADTAKFSATALLAAGLVVWDHLR